MYIEYLTLVENQLLWSVAFIRLNVCGNGFVVQIPVVERSVCTSSTRDDHAVCADTLVCSNHIFVRFIPDLSLFCHLK